jgi:hypothetical protein
VTAYAADFILRTRYEDLLAEVIEPGARVDPRRPRTGAVRLSAAESGEIVRQYLKSLGVTGRANVATVIGSSLKAPLRFAAFANAVGIHAGRRAPNLRKAYSDAAPESTLNNFFLGELSTPQKLADAGRRLAPRLDSWHQLPKTIRPI